MCSLTASDNCLLSGWLIFISPLIVSNDLSTGSGELLLSLKKIETNLFNLLLLFTGFL